MRAVLVRFARSAEVIALLLMLALPLASQTTPTANSSVKAKAPVVLDGKPLFYVQERVLSFSPEDRAAAITSRIDRLSRNLLTDPALITTADSDGSTDIVAGDVVIMSVTDRDATASGMTRQQLASDYASSIRTAVSSLRRARSWKVIALGALYAILSTLVLLLIIRFVSPYFPKLYAKLRSWQGTKIPAVRIQRFELIPAERITDLIVAFVKLVRAAVFLTLFYIYLSLIFSFFPWTHGYARVVLGYVLSPVRLVGRQLADYLPNLFFIAVILVVAFYIARFVRMFFREIGRGTITLSGFYPEWADPTYKISRFLIIAMTAVVVFPYLPGSKSPAFQGVSIFLGILLSLGSTSAVANVVAGVILTYMRAFKIGDRVKIADTVGDVIEKNLLVTRVRTIKNVEVTIANAMVLSSHIVNFSADASKGGLILHTAITIGYDAPWRKVHELLISAANATGNVVHDPAPFVLQTALDDSYVSYELNAYTDQPCAMALTYSELHENIQDKFNEAGVEIMSPQYSAIRDGNTVTIPAADRPADYSAPAFRIADVQPMVHQKKAGAE